MVGAILIHDGEPLDAPRRGAALGDVDDPGVEVAVLAGDAVVYLVGDQMRDAPPILRRRRERESRQLLAGDHVPKAELDLSRPSGCPSTPPVTSAWALISRQSPKRGGVCTSVIC